MSGLRNINKRHRPRERFIHDGPESLSDAELIAIFLGTGSADRDVMATASELLTTCGDLSGLMEASQEQICSIKGIGMAKYVQLKACLETSKRCYKAGLVKESFVCSSNEKARHYLQQELGHAKEECFAVMFLNTQNHLIIFEKLFFGTINSAPVFPRTIARRALELNAASVILAHNHPSGHTEPSEADKHITAHIKKTLELIDVRVLDHIIVGRYQTLSMVQEAIMP